RPGRVPHRLPSGRRLEPRGVARGRVLRAVDHRLGEALDVERLAAERSLPDALVRPVVVVRLDQPAYRLARLVVVEREAFDVDLGLGLIARGRRRLGRRAEVQGTDDRSGEGERGGDTNAGGQAYGQIGRAHV